MHGVTMKITNVKVQNIFHGRNNFTCSTNCKSSCNTIYPKHMVSFRYIIVNTLHEGYNKENNNNNNNNNNNHTIVKVTE
jgi:hypothetical protein